MPTCLLLAIAKWLSLHKVQSTENTWENENNEAFDEFVTNISVPYPETDLDEKCRNSLHTNWVHENWVDVFDVSSNFCLN